MAERIFKRKIYDKILDWKRANIQFWGHSFVCGLRASFWPKATRPTACCSSTSTSRAANRCTAGGPSSATAVSSASVPWQPAIWIDNQPFYTQSSLREPQRVLGDIFCYLLESFSSLRR